MCVLAYDIVYDKFAQLRPHQRDIVPLERIRTIFEFIIPALRDFIFYLRKGQFEQFNEQRYKLFVLLLSADNSGLYKNGEMMNFILQPFWERHISYAPSTSYEHQWGSWRNFFSFLARDEYKKGFRTKITRTSTSYIQIPIIRKLIDNYSRNEENESNELDDIVDWMTSWCTLLCDVPPT